MIPGLIVDLCVEFGDASRIVQKNEQTDNREENLTPANAVRVVTNLQVRYLCLKTRRVY